TLAIDATAQAEPQSLPSIVDVEQEPSVIPEIDRIPAAVSLSLPDFAQPAVTYTALATDNANRIQVEMALRMDRLPHRWQAIYISTGMTPITNEQYHLSEMMHVDM